MFHKEIDTNRTYTSGGDVQNVFSRKFKMMRIYWAGQVPEIKYMALYYSAPIWLISVIFVEHTTSNQVKISREKHFWRKNFKQKQQDYSINWRKWMMEIIAVTDDDKNVSWETSVLLASQNRRRRDELSGPPPSLPSPPTLWAPHPDV